MDHKQAQFKLIEADRKLRAVEETLRAKEQELDALNKQAAQLKPARESHAQDIKRLKAEIDKRDKLVKELQQNASSVAEGSGVEASGVIDGLTPLERWRVKKLVSQLRECLSRASKARADVCQTALENGDVLM